MKRSRWLLLSMATIFAIGLLAAPASAAKTLTFSTQPSNAIKNQTITTIPLDQLDETIDGSFVQVLAAANTRVTVSSVPAGVSRTVKAGADGIATFSNLSIGTPGIYTLTATANGWDPASSGEFRIFDAGEACSGGAVCDPSTGTLNNKGMIATVSGASQGGGVVGVALNIDSSPVCPGDDPVNFNHGPSVLTAFWDNMDGDVLMTLTISAAWDREQPRNGASFYQVCFTFANGKTFRDKFWTPGADEVEVGLLPDCGPQTGVPCVQSRTKSPKGAVIVVIRSPVDPVCR